MTRQALWFFTTRLELFLEQLRPDDDYADPIETRVYAYYKSQQKTSIASYNAYV